MKLFQKTCPLVGILLLSGGVLLAADLQKKEKALTKKKVLKSIEKAYVKVFPRDKGSRLLDEENKNTQKWYKMLSKVRSYVKNNAGENEDLLYAFTLFWNASRKLINVLENTYDSLFAEGTGEISRDNIRTASQNIAELKTESSNLNVIREKLLLSISYSGKKENVKEVLMFLVSRIRWAMNRVVGSYEKKAEDFPKF